VFAAPFSGNVKHFKLVYISGGVAWGAGGSEYEGNWGDKESKQFEVHITNVQNQRIAPPTNYTLADKESLRYDLPGQTHMDPQMIFPEFAPFYPVSKDQVFRIWFGEDLADYEESENSGTTCAHVYMMYAQYVQ
jgi:hypothetical protein